jgi:hypothetical protein
MEMHRNVYVGVLAILLGLIVIIFPLISVATLSILSGIGIIFLGIWLLFQGYKNWGKNLAAGVASLILAFFAFAIGIVFLGRYTCTELCNIPSIIYCGLFPDNNRFNRPIFRKRS